MHCRDYNTRWCNKCYDTVNIISRWRYQLSSIESKRVVVVITHSTVVLVEGCLTLRVYEHAGRVGCFTWRFQLTYNYAKRYSNHAGTSPTNVIISRLRQNIWYIHLRNDSQPHVDSDLGGLHNCELMHAIMLTLWPSVIPSTTQKYLSGGHTCKRGEITGWFTQPYLHSNAQTSFSWHNYRMLFNNK
jgi:hypothetical protein